MIYTARTSTGWNCYDLSDTPDSAQFGSDHVTNGSPTRDGHATDCFLAGGRLEALSGPIGLFIDSTHTDPPVLVGTVTGLGASRLIFGDGSTERLIVDGHTLMFNWTGTRGSRPGADSSR